ncbi:MAG: hypothetical protein QM708_04195 [Propioniciclava sp.]
MFARAGSLASWFLMLSIQAFWLTAVWVEDRIANSPSLPIICAIDFSIWLPILAVSAWLRKNEREAGAMSESHEMTLMPASFALARAAEVLFRSLPEIMITSTFCEISWLTNGIWAAPVASLGEV